MKEIKFYKNKPRAFLDSIVWTHVFLFLSLWACKDDSILFTLTLLTSVFSIIYHKSREHTFINCETILAHLLFFYTTMQLSSAKETFWIEITCFASIVFIYKFLFNRPKEYEKFHYIQHVIAAIWISVIGIRGAAPPHYEQLM